MNCVKYSYFQQMEGNNTILSIIQKNDFCEDSKRELEALISQNVDVDYYEKKIIARLCASL